MTDELSGPEVTVVILAVVSVFVALYPAAAWGV
jgi:hypothetical protein